MHINHGLRIIERTADCLQFGLGPHGLIVDGLQRSDRKFIDRLLSGVAAAEPGGDRPGPGGPGTCVPGPGGSGTGDSGDAAAMADSGTLITAAGACGVDPDRARSLLRALAPVLVLDPPPGSGLTGLRADRLRPDQSQWSASYGCDAGAVLSQRARTVVRVIGLARTGAAIAQSLAVAGIGALVLEESGRVRGCDVGAGAHRLCDVGMPRCSAVRKQIHHLDPTVNVHAVTPPAADSAAGARWLNLDLAVYVGHDVEDSAAISELVSRGQPYLVVLMREQDSLIGPLVVPGQNACLECIERHRADADPLCHVGRPLYPVPDRQPAEAEEATLAMATAGLAAMQSLLFLDAVNEPSCSSAVVRLRAADGSMSRQAYEPHPQCGCRLQQPAAEMIRT